MIKFTWNILNLNYRRDAVKKRFPDNRNLDLEKVEDEEPICILSKLHSKFLIAILTYSCHGGMGAGEKKWKRHWTPIGTACDLGNKIALKLLGGGSYCNPALIH